MLNFPQNFVFQKIESGHHSPEATPPGQAASWALRGSGQQTTSTGNVVARLRPAGHEIVHTFNLAPDRMTFPAGFRLHSHAAKGSGKSYANWPEVRTANTRCPASDLTLPSVLRMRGRCSAADLR